MNFCSNCGHKTEWRVPEDDNRPRHVCDNCNTIHYDNPKIICGCLVTYKDQVLLCKRAIEPRHGKWTLPAGFMENGETASEGALRETWEESGARPRLNGLYSLCSIAHISQVYMIFHATLDEPIFEAGPESLDVQLFSPENIPWDELAFHTVAETLRKWIEDKHQSPLPLRTFDITQPKTAEV